MSDSLPRLLLVSPYLDDQSLCDSFAKALAALASVDIAALVLRGDALDDGIAPLVGEAQARGIAVLLQDRPDLLVASGADGLHVTLAEKKSPIKELRRRFGDDVILGAGCGASRHLAMTAGEQGADYIAFGAFEGEPADPEVIAWWEAVMTPPQVACGAADLDQARALSAVGPDFLAVSPLLWQAGDDPAEALQSLLTALANTA